MKVCNVFIFIYCKFIEEPHFYRKCDISCRFFILIIYFLFSVAAAIRELRNVVVPFMLNVVRHYTAVAVSQQSGPFIGTRKVKPQGIDPLVLIDATAAIMGHEEKELCKPGTVALCVILDTANSIMGSSERVSCASCHIRIFHMNQR